VNVTPSAPVAVIPFEPTTVIPADTDPALKTKISSSAIAVLNCLFIDLCKLWSINDKRLGQRELQLVNVGMFELKKRRSSKPSPQSGLSAQ